MSMKNDDYNEILARIKHIKSLFAFGEGILPFLEELFLFLREVSPLLNDVSESIMNTTGMMPEATVELDQAVDQTSDATYRIMDHVESINAKLDALESGENHSEQMLALLAEIRQDSHSIMNALQFHDIVSQKLIHVRKVLAEIQKKMLNLFTRVYELEIEDDVKANILTTFGVNVGEFKRIMDTKIEIGSELTASKKAPKKQEPVVAPAQFNQDDIDSLFG